MKFTRAEMQAKGVSSMEDFANVRLNKMREGVETSDYMDDELEDVRKESSSMRNNSSSGVIDDEGSGLLSSYRTSSSNRDSSGKRPHVSNGDEEDMFASPSRKYSSGRTKGVIVKQKNSTIKSTSTDNKDKATFQTSSTATTQSAVEFIPKKSRVRKRIPRVAVLIPPSQLYSYKQLVQKAQWSKEKSDASPATPYIAERDLRSFREVFQGCLDNGINSNQYIEKTDHCLTVNFTPVPVHKNIIFECVQCKRETVSSVDSPVKNPSFFVCKDCLL